MNHVDRAAWQEVWEAASAAEKLQLESDTRESLARILAHRVHGADDGYGLRAHYGLPLHDSSLPPAPFSDPDGSLAAVHGALSVSAVDLRYAVQALANLGHPKSARHVAALAEHRRLDVRSFAVHALRDLPGPESHAVLLGVLGDATEDLLVRGHAADVLADWAPHELANGEGGAPAVLRTALSHLATNEGVDWDTCPTECARACSQRSVLACQSSCRTHCQQRLALEESTIDLVRSHWEDVINEQVATSPGCGSDCEQVEKHKRLLEAAAAAGESDISSEHLTKGARRLGSALERLEKLFSVTRFQFRAGVRNRWVLDVGAMAIGAKAGVKVENAVTLDISLMSGVFAVDFGTFLFSVCTGVFLTCVCADNWAGALVKFIIPLEFFEAKIAFTAGFSYVNKAAGNLLSAAQAGFGSLVRNARKLGGRAIGYIVRFHEHLENLLQRIDDYIDTGDRFLVLISDFETMSGVVQQLAVQGLQKTEQHLAELLRKYVRWRFLSMRFCDVHSVLL